MATKFITVSIEIMRDSNLNQSQKFIMAEIEQLSSLKKGCIASNSHFSELIGITKENVSRNINELEKKGYINIEIKNGSRNHTRIITLTKIVRPPYQNSKTPLSKQQETKENIQSNIQINKESNNNFINPTIEEVISYSIEYSNKTNLQRIQEHNWYEYYSSKNWKLSNGKDIKDWKATIRTWYGKQPKIKKQVKRYV